MNKSDIWRASILAEALAAAAVALEEGKDANARALARAMCAQALHVCGWWATTDVMAQPVTLPRSEYKYTEV